jgi:DNA replication protein DnaC
MEYNIESVCPRCYANTTVKSEKEGNGFPVYEICDKCVSILKKHWIEQINNKGEEYKHFTFSDFVTLKDNQKNVEICKKFAERQIPRFGLWLYSPDAGNGKTHLSYATLRHWIENVYEPEMGKNNRIVCPYADVTEPELLLRIRSTYRSNEGEDESDVLDEYKNVEFMILDDIGKTNANDLSFMQRTIYTIIDYRYLRHKLTVISSNKNGAELQQYLGLYTFDRLRGMSEKVTEIHGESYRGKK